MRSTTRCNLSARRSPLYASAKPPPWHRCCWLPARRTCGSHSRTRPSSCTSRPVASRGKRPTFMLHAQEILNLKKRLNEIYVKHTGQPLKKIEDALERDYFLTGEMAMEWGIVDKVINKRPEDPAAIKVV